MSSTDVQAVLPASSTLTSGVKIFSITLKTEGGKNIVAADSFGNIADGNVGELLQQLPGVSGEYNGQDIRSVQIRHMKLGSISVGDAPAIA